MKNDIRDCLLFPAPLELQLMPFKLAVDPIDVVDPFLPPEDRDSGDFGLESDPGLDWNESDSVTSGPIVESFRSFDARLSFDPFDTLLPLPPPLAALDNDLNRLPLLDDELLLLLESA